MTAATYYKATRPDGTDFYTGMILYEVGRRVRPARFTGTPELCGPGYLHASDVPAETLVGGWWPCRLFEVTGTSRAQSSHKHGFRQLTVIRELPAHEALGPNGREVAELIGRAGRLTADERDRLGAAWDAARYARGARDAALALVVRDLIPAEHFNTLYGPWASVIDPEGSDATQ